VTRDLALGLCLLLGAAACGGGGDAPAAAADPAADLEADGAVNVQAVRDSVRRARAAAPAPLDTAGLGSEGVRRETFAYGGGGRDPFVSLLDAEQIGPEFGDLQLLGIYFDGARPARSVAVLRDRVSGKRYSLKSGDRAGRLSVVSVRQRDVLFSIEDFGFERQETLSLPKREVELQ
jgi:hypothetical protein